MKWERVDKYAEQSSDGRYSVAAIGFDCGRAGTFEAWRRRKHKDGPGRVTRVAYKTAAEARAACEADNKRTEPAVPRVKESRKKSNAWSDVHGG